VVLTAWGIGMVLGSTVLANPLPKANKEQAAREATEIGRVSLVEMKAALAQGGITIIDTRKSDLYKIGRIPGAVSFGLADKGKPLPVELGEGSKTKAIIVYCSSQRCTEAQAMAEYIASQVPTARVSIFAGGWAEWRRSGNRVER